MKTGYWLSYSNLTEVPTGEIKGSQYKSLKSSKIGGKSRSRIDIAFSMRELNARYRYRFISDSESRQDFFN